MGHLLLKRPIDPTNLQFPPCANVYGCANDNGLKEEEEEARREEEVPLGGGRES